MKYFFSWVLFFSLLSSCTQPIHFGTKENQERPESVDLSAMGNQVIQEDSDVLIVPFKLSGPNTEPEKTIFQLSSSDTSILEKPYVTFDSAAQEFLLHLTPVPNKNGEVKVSIRVNNGFSDQKKEITVLVESINDLPVVYSSAEIKFKVGQLKPNSIEFKIHDVETSAEKLLTNFEFTQESLFEPGSIVIDSESKGATQQILFKKAPVAPGNGFLKIKAQDEHGGVGLVAVHVVVDQATNQSPELRGVPSELRVGSGQKSVPITIDMTDDTSTPLGLSFRIVSQDPNILPQKNIVISGNGYKREVVFLAPQDKKGKVKITFEVSDTKDTTKKELVLEIY